MMRFFLLDCLCAGDLAGCFARNCSVLATLLVDLNFCNRSDAIFLAWFCAGSL